MVLVSADRIDRGLSSVSVELEAGVPTPESLLSLASALVDPWLEAGGAAGVGLGLDDAADFLRLKLPRNPNGFSLCDDDELREEADDRKLVPSSFFFFS